MLASLASQQPVTKRVALVVAHPDDETIAAGGSLTLIPSLTMVHVTDGAPQRMADAGRLGFATAEAYASAREAELTAALAIAGVAPDRVRLGVSDQDASLCMSAIAAQLARIFAEHSTEIVLTHAYEGGHPDHDATALAVHVAAQKLGLPVVEFPGYHAGPDLGMTLQRFLPGPLETRVDLHAEAIARKRAMLDCFVSQARVLALFGSAVERFRPAPGYDFTVAPHAGTLNYENWGWEMTGARWRDLAAEALPWPT